MIRKDNPDFVYLTQSDKFKAIIEDIRECAAREQPVLVGTTSIETSEFLSGLLQKEAVAHQVLNAKQHEREAHIVAQAGRPGTVTIATNMAGRGTDIVLGGNLEAELAAAGAIDDATREKVRAEWQIRHDKVVTAGGLHIVGTERHESRRIDNQLRGRSGRQGDPGSSRFYLSMEDNLMRIFGDPLRTQRLLKMAGMKEGEVIESGMLTRQIEKAQRKVEAHNFDIRKNLLLFDDVANDQRKVVYQQRTEIMGTEDLSGAIRGLMEDSVGSLLDLHLPRHAASSDWDLQGLAEAVLRDFNVRVDPQSWLSAEPELEEQAHVEVARHRIGEPLKIPVGGSRLLRHVLIEERAHRVIHQAANGVREVLGGHDLGPLRVHDLALVVGDVVEEQQVLADIEVVCLDLALRLLDLAGEHAALDHLVFLHPRHLQEALGAQRIPEDAHQVVFHRQIEAARARVALAARAAAQLVVDAAGLVALGADDVQPAGGEHLVVPRLPFGAQPLAADLVELRRRGGELGVEIATEHDVGTAPGHVGGDGHGAGSTRLRYDVRLALVLLGVQHLVLDAFLLQEPG